MVITCRLPYHSICFKFVTLLLLLVCCRYDDIAFVESLVPADGSLAASVLPWLRHNPPSGSITTSKNGDSLVTASTTIRIQKTMESDLTDVASFLASASQQQSARPSNNLWRNKIDLLFAKSDIEALIRRRWRILDKVLSASMRVKKQLQSNPPTDQLLFSAPHEFELLFSR
jgi:hypothetical protein